MTKRLALATFAIITACSIGTKSYAGGFPLRPGRFLFSPSYNYFYDNKQWDKFGHLGPVPNNGSFTSSSIYLYMEYGISRRFAFVASAPYLINESKYTAQDLSIVDSRSSGIGDVETGIRYYLANIAYKYYFTLQATAITPTYRNSKGFSGSPLGYGEEGAELRLAFASSGKLFGNNYYYDIEDGVRQYFGTAGPFQNRYYGVFGQSLDRASQNTLTLAVSGFMSYSSDKNFSTNPFVNKDFSFMQISVGYGHAFSKNLSASIAYNKFIFGRNTGAGSGFSAALIYKFDTR